MSTKSLKAVQAAIEATGAKVMDDLRGLERRLGGGGPAHVYGAADIRASVGGPADLSAAYEHEQRACGGYLAAVARNGARGSLQRILSALPPSAVLDEAGMNELLDRHGITDITTRIALKSQAHLEGRML